MKQLAWVARNTGGDASVVISNALAGIPLPPDVLVKYSEALARADTAWTAIENFSGGLPLPANLIEPFRMAGRNSLPPK
jgi:hypothetical protein